MLLMYKSRSFTRVNNFDLRNSKLHAVRQRRLSSCLFRDAINKHKTLLEHDQQLPESTLYLAESIRTAFSGLPSCKAFEVTLCDSLCMCCRKSEAQNRAVVLEMIGDLPEADSKPPSNMLFIAKLNPVTTEEDLETIFGRFGNITSCDIIRDKKTGDSLCYAFLGYDTDEASENAYFKMNNVLIDDRRIKVRAAITSHHRVMSQSVDMTQHMAYGPESLLYEHCRVSGATL